MTSDVNNGSVYNESDVTPFASVLSDTGSGFYVDSRFSVAQSFTATTDGYLALVNLAMVDWGSDSAYAQVEIQTDSGSDTPSGMSISSTETQDWPSSVAWERVTFFNPAKIIAGEKYWIVATCPDSNPDGYLWLFNDGSVYAGGGMSGWDNEAPSPSWTTESGTYDCLFKAYTYAYDTVVRFYDGDPGTGGTQIGSEQHLSPVPASGTKAASVPWTAIAGSHDIYVVEDPATLIPETNETNNKAYKSLLVENEAPPAIDFEDVTSEADLIDPLLGGYLHAASWGDVDNDGWIDLFFGTFTADPLSYYQERGATGPAPSRLLLNKSGVFQESNQASLNKYAVISGSVFIDLDNDGDLDLVISNYRIPGSLKPQEQEYSSVYRNDGGVFQDVSPAVSITTIFDPPLTTYFDPPG